VELDRTGLDTVRVDEVRCEVRRENRVGVGGGEAGKKRVEADLTDEALGEGAGHDGAAEGEVVIESRALELILELNELAGEVVGEAVSRGKGQRSLRGKEALQKRKDVQGVGLLRLLVLVPDRLELVVGVLRHGGLNRANVLVVEVRGRLSRGGGHEVDELLVVE
jgi:hypothetical protein